MQLTATLMALLEGFRPVFTAPSFATFQLLMTGWILSTRHRYVTDLIISSDSVDNGHFSDYHRFFSHAQWDINHLWRIVARLLVGSLIGKDAVIILAGDDTLCRKRGLGLFGAGMHHDPLISSRQMKLVRWGHDWVTLSLIVAYPWWAPTKVFALPICMRQMLQLAASWFPDRRVVRASACQPDRTGPPPQERQPPADPSTVGSRQDALDTDHV